MSGTKYKMVVDIATDRIITYVSDTTPLDETHMEGAALAFYEGLLPTGMTPRNSWSYRLQNQKIVAPTPKTAKPIESVLAATKRTTLETMRKVLDAWRKEQGVPQTVAEYLMHSNVDAATALCNQSELAFNKCAELVGKAAHSSELIMLKTQFQEKLYEIKT